MEKYKTYNQSYLITDDYYLKEFGNLFDIGKLIRHTLYVSGEHDKYLQREINVKLIKQDQTWVITQYYIKQHQLPKLNDQIWVRTRVIDANRFFITRYFDVYTEQDLLYEVYTQYTVIDLNSRKMVRMNVDPLEHNQLIDTEFTAAFNRFVKPDSFDYYLTTEKVIHENDIDYNNHVNNLVYLNWAFSSLPEDLVKNYSIDTIEVKYGKELRRDNQVMIESFGSKQDDNHIETYQIIKDKDNGKDACYVRIQWQQEEKKL
ncbi:acyl-[acyl-carrier-protein] thioesterase [Fundicoccus culcitae]|uniref:Thioesterase n=1 Tax=Fundicoccus culcitae TaxID=2969821 RepID=A0ABY5P9U3_9LACT|nr:acyl-ACP thioesterase domain-containing protein [Fundicoccus culcitae]UUX35526.1 thioesterase [Fundicoccus culcitae]